MNNDHLPEIVMSDVETTGKPLVTPEQRDARTAFVNFCNNLDLAISRRPDEPSLPAAATHTIRSFLTRSVGDIEAEGIRLWDALEAVGVGELPLAIQMTRDHLSGLFVQFARTKGDVSNG